MRLRILCGATFAVLGLISTQIAIPLVPGRVAGLSWVVIAFLVVATWTYAGISWSWRQRSLVLLAVFCGSTMIEILGVQTGVPFGRYSYASVLQPQAFDVPLLVGVAWAAMMLPSLELSRRISPRPAVQALLTGVGLALWDVFLDPQMIRNGFWAFDNPSGWRGLVPWTNFVGWIVSGALLACVPLRFLPSTKPNNGLAFLYVWMVGFSALGFLIPFALDDWPVGVIGTLAVSPFVYLAFRKGERPWLA